MSDKITMTPSQMIARLEVANAETKATIREAHETIQSLRGLVREATACLRDLREVPPEIVSERIQAAVHAQLDGFGPEMRERMDVSVEHITAEFEKLRDAMLGGGRSGNPPLIEAAKQYAKHKVSAQGAYLPDQGIRAGSCPECGAHVRGMAAVTGPKDVRPSPGDVSVCSVCGAASRVTADLGRRPLLDFELDQMAMEEREAIVLAQAAIRARPARLAP